MEAGSGGIRWNSETNWIQLADENKNWIDWRYYNTDYEVNHEVTYSQSGTVVNYTFTKRGLYCLCANGYQSSATAAIKCSGVQVVNTISPNMSNTSAQEVIVYSEGSGTATLSTKFANYGSQIVVIYIGPYTNISNPGYFQSSGTASSFSQTFNTHNQFIHFVIMGQTRYARSFNTSGIENRYISIYDSGWQNQYSAACINHNGNVTCTGIAGSQDYAGGLFVTYYTLEI